MDIRKLQRAIVDGLEDVKAQNIAVFNTEHLTSMFERVIVASGSSNRQTKALASSVRETVKERGLPVLSVEGADNGEWIIVDCGAAVAHIMQPAIRDYYRLEEIWGEKPVKMKIDGESRPAVVASPAAKKPAPAKNAAPAKAVAKKRPVGTKAAAKPTRKALPRAR
jgi:ribosome-associated protein